MTDREVERERGKVTSRIAGLSCCEMRRRGRRGEGEEEGGVGDVVVYV